MGGAGGGGAYKHVKMKYIIKTIFNIANVEGKSRLNKLLLFSFVLKLPLQEEQGGQEGGEQMWVA